MATREFQLSRVQVTAVIAHYRALIMICGLTLLGGAARFFEAGANGYRLDEVWSLWISRQSIPDMFGSFLLDNLDATPPTYYALLHPLLAFGQDPFIVRSISILAGMLMVPVTFKLASFLFDLRVAALSGTLMAIAPLQIEYSQVARAYTLSALLAFTSIYLFARLISGDRNRSTWILYTAAGAAMLYAHYLTVLALAFEGAFLAALWLRLRARRPIAKRVLAAQGVIALAALPLGITSLYTLTHMKSGRGLAWLPHPDLQAMIKSVILFTTGDPSYGPAAITLPRLLSFGTLVAIGVLGVWLYVKQVHGRPSSEGMPVALLTGAALLPTGVALLVAQFRPIYHEKYLLYAIPPLLILLSWALARSAHKLPALILGLALVSLTGTSLYVYYTSPSGEQWREAVAYVEHNAAKGDLVIASPGYYGRPLAYYMYGAFPEDMRSLSFAEGVELDTGAASFSALELNSEPDQVLSSRLITDSGGDVWLLSGYAPPDVELVDWLGSHFVLADSAQFLGVQVRKFAPLSGN